MCIRDSVYGVDASAFAAFPVNAHANAVSNAQAMYRFKINAEKVTAAAMVADPISLLDSSTLADGAAALILVSPAIAREIGRPLIRIAGSAVASDTLALHGRSDPLWLDAAARVTQAALKAAQLQRSDIQLLDLSDQHGIAAALALESSGFVERGSATSMAREGGIHVNGTLPLATACLLYTSRCV